MENAYADVIVDISSGELDRVFQYRIPEKMRDRVKEGTLVTVPFGRGNRSVRAYVIEISQKAEIEEEKIKEIFSVPQEPVTVESKLIALAVWMKETYGCTMLQALKTVLPMKEKVKEKKKRKIILALSQEEAKEALAKCERKHQSARVRLLRALLKEEVLDYKEALADLGLTAGALRTAQEKGLIRLEEEQV